MLFFMGMDLVTDKSGINISYEIIIYGACAGLSFGAACFSTYLALGCGSYVFSRLVLSYGIIITIVHGFILGETINVFGWIGLVLIIGSLYFVKGSEKNDSVKITKKWVITIGLSVLFAGLFGILQRQQQRIYGGVFDNEFMIITLAVSSVSLFIVGVIKEGKNLGYILKNGSLYALGAGVANGATNLLSLYVYGIAPMSFVAPMSAGVSIIISFLISKIIFREKFSKLQYVSVVLGAIALVLFKL
jgi:drug/metabolite transporter (DMT)-like permease